MSKFLCITNSKTVGLVFQNTTRKQHRDLHCSKTSFKCVNIACASSAIWETLSDSLTASAAKKDLFSASAIILAAVLAASSNVSAEVVDIDSCNGLDLTSLCFGIGVSVPNAASLIL